MTPQLKQALLAGDIIPNRLAHYNFYEFEVDIPVVHDEPDEDPWNNALLLFSVVTVYGTPQDSRQTLGGSFGYDSRAGVAMHKRLRTEVWRALQRGTPPDALYIVGTWSARL